MSWTNLSIANLVAVGITDCRSGVLPLTWFRGADGAAGGVFVGRRLSERLGALTDVDSPFTLFFSEVTGADAFG